MTREALSENKAQLGIIYLYKAYVLSRLGFPSFKQIIIKKVFICVRQFIETWGELGEGKA